MPTPGPLASETAALPSLPAFRAWSANARPGDWILYHRGFLARNRILDVSHSDQSERKRLARIADHALALVGQGQLDRLQERLGKSDYAYWAVARVQMPGGRA